MPRSGSGLRAARLLRIGSKALSTALSTALSVALSTTALLAVALPGTARAEDIKTFEVSGEADAAAADSRGVAVDAAFAQATEDALDDLLPRAVRTEQRAVLNKEIVGRARRWVSSYKVTGDQERGGKRQLAVAVRINREALQARLVELGIVAGASTEPSTGDPSTREPSTDRSGPVTSPEGRDPSGSQIGPVDPSLDPSRDPSLGRSRTPAPSSSADPRWAGRTATLLLRVRRQAQALATFGASGDGKTPGAAIAADVMAERGLVVKPSPLAGPSPRDERELPLDDGQARALAGSARAELAVIVGVELSERQYVRGVPTPMVLASAVARVVARGEGAEGEGKGSAVAIAGDGDRQAIDRAVVTAVDSALPTTAAGRAAVPSLTTDDQPLPPAVAGGAWLRISAHTPWSVVSALLRHYAKQQGYTAELRRLSPAGYLVLVHADKGIDRAAAIARSLQLPEGSGALKVRSDRGVITVRVEAP
jgi:hypothetical protein